MSPYFVKFHWYEQHKFWFWQPHLNSTEFELFKKQGEEGWYCGNENPRWRMSTSQEGKRKISAGQVPVDTADCQQCKDQKCKAPHYRCAYGADSNEQESDLLLTHIECIPRLPFVLSLSERWWIIPFDKPKHTHTHRICRTTAGPFEWWHLKVWSGGSCAAHISQQRFYHFYQCLQITGFSFLFDTQIITRVSFRFRF